MAWLLCAAVVLFQAPADGPPPRPVTSPLRYVPAPGYRPAVGDVVFLYATTLDGKRRAASLGYRGWLAYDEYAKSVRADDGVGLLKVTISEDCVLLAADVRLLVIELGPGDPGDAGPARYAIVRVLNGPEKGEKLWVRASRLARDLVPNPLYSPLDGETAATLLAAAVGLEKEGKAREAEQAYRDVVLFFPDSDEGYKAAGWVKLAEKKASEKLKASAPARLLKLAKDLEKAGKRPGAAARYRELLKFHPDAPEAAEAKARLKAAGAGG